MYNFFANDNIDKKKFEDTKDAIRIRKKKLKDPMPYSVVSWNGDAYEGVSISDRK